MKKQTQNIVGAVIMTCFYTLTTLGFGTLTVSCKENPDPICECLDKDLDIDELCNCGLKNCKCEPTVYGTLENGVKIYRKGDIEQAKVIGITERAIAVYSDLTKWSKEYFDANITEIHIVLGNHEQTVRRGTILELGVDITQGPLEMYFDDISIISEVAKGLNPTVKKAWIASGDALVPVTHFS